MSSCGDAMPSPRPSWLPIAAILTLASVGCTDRYLARTPNQLCIQDPNTAYSNCPEALRRPDMSVLYATDRDVVDKTPKLTYGSGRASTLVFGSAKVDLTPKLGWTDLV